MLIDVSDTALSVFRSTSDSVRSSILLIVLIYNTEIILRPGLQYLISFNYEVRSYALLGQLPCLSYLAASIFHRSLPS